MANGGGVVSVYWIMILSNPFGKGRRRHILMRGTCGYAGGELSQKIDFATTTVVFGMEMVVILLVNLLVNLTRQL